jgi:hypothetical protein
MSSGKPSAAEASAQATNISVEVRASSAAPPALILSIESIVASSTLGSGFELHDRNPDATER